jgi:hypothetical protein
MKLNILCDADWEAKIDKVLHTFTDSGYRQFFEERKYGSSIEGIVIGLICLESSLNLKQRIKYVKKEKKIYIDIMLDLDQFKQLDQDQRVKIASEKIITQVPVIISKFTIEDFDQAKFRQDLTKWFNQFLK